MGDPHAKDYRILGSRHGVPPLFKHISRGTWNIGGNVLENGTRVGFRVRGSGIPSFGDITGNRMNTKIEK